MHTFESGGNRVGFSLRSLGRHKTGPYTYFCHGELVKEAFGTLRPNTGAHRLNSEIDHAVLRTAAINNLPLFILISVCIIKKS